MSKYNAKKTIVDGIKFDSVRESKRYLVLKEMEKQGKISDLQLQVPYTILPKNDKYRAMTYKADFVYFQDGQRVVEDCKGFKTKEYLLKKKLVYGLLGIDIKES